MRVGAFFHIAEAFCNKFHSLKRLKCQVMHLCNTTDYFELVKKTKILEPTSTRKKFFFRAKFTKGINPCSMPIISHVSD